MLPAWLQATVIVVCLGTFGGMSYLAAGYFAVERDVAKRAQAADAGAKLALAGADVGNIAALTQQLAAAEGQYSSLQKRYDETIASAAVTAEEAGQNPAAGRGNVGDLRKSADHLKARLKQSAQARAAEAIRVRQLKTKARTLTANVRSLQATIAKKDKQMVMLRSRSGAAAGTRSADDRPAIALKTGTSAGRLEHILTATGVDINRIIRHIDSQPDAAVGGPFVSLDSMRSSAAEQRRIAALLKVAKVLPLRSPLAVAYSVGSPFGARPDPFNRRLEEFHTGLDMDAPYRSSVYSTAPGVVTFTGWEGGYGRLVKIDHGNGIETLYAHLHRILVARGERVAAHTLIGRLGSTGRSTGPHLHYEVRVDGRPVNPVKFLDAGRNVVQVSAR